MRKLIKILGIIWFTALVLETVFFALDLDILGTLFMSVALSCAVTYIIDIFVQRQKRRKKSA